MGVLDFLFSRDGEKPAPAAKSETVDPGAPATGGRHAEIVAALQAHLAEVAVAQGKKPERGYDPEVGLYDAGYLDSLSMSQFLVLAEKQYGIEIPDWVLGEQARTLNKLAGWIEAALAKKSP